MEPYTGYRDYKVQFIYLALDSNRGSVSLMSAVRRSRTRIRTMSQQIPRIQTESIARPFLLGWITVTGFAWIGLLVAVFGLSWPTGDTGQQLLLIVGVSVVAAVTYVPVEYYLAARGVAVRGMCGSVLLFVVLLYVPVPTRSILSLFDVPVYLLISMALYWSISSFMLPIMYGIGQLVFSGRSRRYDVRRAYRQASLVGLVAVGVILLVGLRAMTPFFFGLWVLLLISLELLFLWYVEPPTTR